MKVLLVTLTPEHAAAEPESPAQALRDLGCDVRCFGFDLGLDEDDLVKEPPQVIVMDARERLETAYACLKTLRDLPPPGSTPSLLALTLGRLPSLALPSADR